MSKAREALLKSENDYKKALDWLEKDATFSGAQKAAKLDNRAVNQGIVAIIGGSNGIQTESPLMFGRSAMIELNCETDFVAKSELFVDLTRKVLVSVYLLADSIAKESNSLQELDLDACLNAPLLPFNTLTVPERSVKESIVETIGKLGENIQLKKAIAVVPKSTCETCRSGFLASGAYVHGSGLANGMGRIGSLVSLNVQNTTKAETKELLMPIARQIAQHIVGMNPTESELLDQEFLFGGGSVKQVLEKFNSDHKLNVSIDKFKRLEIK